MLDGGRYLARELVVDCVKVPGLAVRGSLGTTPARSQMGKRHDDPSTPAAGQRAQLVGDCPHMGQLLPPSVPPSHSRCASHGVEGNGGQLGLWKSALFSRKLISPAIAFWAIGE